MSSPAMSPFDKRLCNVLQEELPLRRRPFAELAGAIGADETAVLEAAARLMDRGIIRRIAAVPNWRALGMSSTLVAAHVPADKLDTVIEAVNALAGVSHNYLREHRYNLWFTLRADSRPQMEEILAGLKNRVAVDFFSLPAVRMFKLDARFDAESGGRRLLPGGTKPIEPAPLNLEQADSRILSRLLHGLEVTDEPFAPLCTRDLRLDEVFAHIKTMIEKGIIHRVGAVVDHRKLGFTANAMFVCAAEQHRVEQVAQALALEPNVSHCYQRRPFEGWPFNVFAMMHGPNLEEIRNSVAAFVRSHRLNLSELLPTVSELKKGSPKSIHP